MNHEFWNEIGNLYFMCGAYEPAIHAYLRSIKLDNTFGRSYSNLAMAYVQTHKYNEAIKLYRRSIELLSDNKEKAVTWNRLGILYRQIKEYDNALEAYQRADLIMPQEDAEKLSQAHAEIKLPLAVSMPEIDLDSILAKGNLEKFQSQSDLLTEINSELEIAEADQNGVIFEEMLETSSVKTVDLSEFENYSQSEELTFEPPVSTHSEWKFAYADEILMIEKPAPETQEIAFTAVEDFNFIVPIEIQKELVIVDDENITLALPIEAQPELDSHSSVEELDIAEINAFFKNDNLSESVEVVTSEAQIETTQPAEENYPLVDDLSPEERKALEMDIIKYQQETTRLPSSYILWEGLGEAYKSAGQYKDAILAFQKAIETNPRNPMSHYRLGLVYAAERKEQEAIKSFKKVLELDPNLAQAHASLASQYRKMGFEEAAQSHIEKARALQLEDESDYNHACLEAICGNNDRALEFLEVALQSKQTYVTWVQKDPDFDTLRTDNRFQTLLSSHAMMA